MAEQLTYLGLMKRERLGRQGSRGDKAVVEEEGGAQATHWSSTQQKRMQHPGHAAQSSAHWAMGVPPHTTDAALRRF